MEKHRLLMDLSSEAYHASEGSHSSSQLKDMLADEELFHAKYIAKTIPREEFSAFDVGTYFHTGLLEPEKLSTEIVVFNGKIRRGAHWERFKADNVGKTIVSQPQVDAAERLIASVKNSPVAMAYIEDGSPEVSLFVDLIVRDGEIFSIYSQKKMTRNGWVDFTLKPLKKDIKLTLKVRADILGDKYVFDLKSTTGNAKDQRAMEEKIRYYNYDLSASLYLDIFSLLSLEPYSWFIWTFASKDFFNTKTYAASPENIMVGRAKWMKAVLKLAEAIRAEWKFQDSIGILNPCYSELIYLKESETDYL
jgi:hypothetical protein